MARGTHVSDEAGAFHPYEGVGPVPAGDYYALVVEHGTWWVLVRQGARGYRIRVGPEAPQTFGTPAFIERYITPALVYVAHVEAQEDNGE